MPQRSGAPLLLVSPLLASALPELLASPLPEELQAFVDALNAVEGANG